MRSCLFGKINQFEIMMQCNLICDLSAELDRISELNDMLHNEFDSSIIIYHAFYVDFQVRVESIKDVMGSKLHKRNWASYV